MPLFINSQVRGCKWLSVWKIEETEAELLPMLSLCGEAEQQLKIITCPEKRREWLASRLLLAQLTGSNNAVRYNPNGKPYVEGSGMGLSISHTRGFAAVVASRDGQAGVDIEYPSARISRVAHRFIHPQEECFFESADRERYLSLVWCAKETLYKIAGTPGLEFKRDLRIEPFAAENRGVMKGSLLFLTPPTLYNLNYLIHPAFYLVWHW